MNSNAVSCIVSLVVITFLGPMCCVSAFKCYQCESKNDPTCLESVFLGVGKTVVDGCMCCTKHVDSEGTKRDCATLNCLPTSSHLVCMSDHCNTGSALRRPGLAVVALAAILVAAFISRLR